MIRLTLLLLAGIAIVFVIAGDPAKAPDPEPRQPAPGAVAEAPAAPALPVAPVTDEDRAVARALAATSRADRAPAAARDADADAAELEPDPPPQAGEAPRRDETAEAAEIRSGGDSVVQDDAEEDPSLLYVTGSQVNLRAGPSTADRVIGTARQGDAAELLDEMADGWMLVRFVETGQDAFVFGTFLGPEAP